MTTNPMGHVHPPMPSMSAGGDPALVLKSPAELGERSTPGTTSPAPGSKVQQAGVFKIQPLSWVQGTFLTF